MHSHEKLFIGIGGVLGVNELGPIGARGLWHTLSKSAAFKENEIDSEYVFQGLNIIDVNTTLILMMLINIGILFLPNKSPSNKN